MLTMFISDRIEECDFVAHNRSGERDRNGVDPQISAWTNGERGTRIGTYGEMAVRRFFKVSEVLPFVTTGVRPSTLWIPFHGLRIAVKTRQLSPRYENDLLVPYDQWNRERADVYVLCELRDDPFDGAVDIVGWAWKSDVADNLKAFDSFRAGYERTRWYPRDLLYTDFEKKWRTLIG